MEFYKLPEKCNFLTSDIELKTNIKDENGEFYISNEIKKHISIGSAVNVDYDRFTCQIFEDLSVDKLIFSVKIDIKSITNGGLTKIIFDNVDRAFWDKYGIIDVDIE